MQDWKEVGQELLDDGCVYLVARATQGLVDPGAGSDLVGLAALNRESKALAAIGMKYELIPRHHQRPRAAHGVGGAAKVASSVG
eukprot:3229148-Pyramimonas_sp.AAC.1